MKRLLAAGLWGVQQACEALTEIARVSGVRLTTTCPSRMRPLRHCSKSSTPRSLYETN